MKPYLLFAALIGAAASGAGYNLYLSLRHQAGLDSPYPSVVGMPPEARRTLIPAASGPHPRHIQRPADTFAYPIEYGASGPVEALFAGPAQYPFLCQSEEGGLGQPMIDNTQGWGIPVYAEDRQGHRSGQIIGYSKDCSLPTRLHYIYYDAGSTELVGKRVDDDIGKVPDDSGLLVRVETGTINRYIYAIMMPTTHNDQLQDPDTTVWNGKLIYYFRGGISIGFQQGKVRIERLVRDVKEALAQGYAVVYSSANETDNTYNITLQEDTALRVKQQFASRYGTPRFTMGIGGSGGGLQQYLLAQNRPGIIDGGVALISYPDMVTQVHYALDCELLEYYFDHLSADRDFWADPTHREAVMGLSVAGAPAPGKEPRLQWLQNAASLLRYEWPNKTAPGSECNAGWRGSTPLINNPNFHSDWQRFSSGVFNRTYWTHWQDNRDVYGTNRRGRAPSPWSNLGVQYGLTALQQGQLSIEQFLDLNRRIGSWRSGENMTPEHLWHISGDSRLYRLTPYGEHNMTHGGQAMNVAPRFHGSLRAASGAYWSGNVYLGQLDIPIMDVRMYLDGEQNIHHTWAALSTRERIRAAGSDTSLNPLWITTKPFNPMWDAINTLDRWITRERELAEDPDFHGDPRSRWQTARPLEAEDTCFASAGTVIAHGNDVWDGEWNNSEDGPCTRLMPFHKGSRQISGDAITGYTFHCALIPVEEAIQAGFYGEQDMRPQLEQLREIFPYGVCDYRQPDLARPAALPVWKPFG